ncbi:MAG: hypothetical protein GPI92_03620 [Microcystis aeruginosa K13-06]|nr:hypothetical protein [Microcystis aeruginosa K13-06]
MNNLQTVLPSAKTPMEVRLCVPVAVVGREIEALGLASKNWATVTSAPTVKLAPMVAFSKDTVIVSVAIVFSLSDMFEFEEFDNILPDYYTPRKKCNLFLLVCFLNYC